MIDEKNVTELPKRPHSWRRNVLLGLIPVSVLCVLGWSQSLGHHSSCHLGNLGSQFELEQADELCRIYDKVEFKDPEYSVHILKDAEFRNQSVTRLSKAIQIPTWVEDEGTDFIKFDRFHEYLETEFKAVFDAANVFKINTYGIVLEFPGSDLSLKPAMFTAHQDTVPPGDANNWEKDPFSGYYDVNGRIGC
ncbi:hypothetical protein OGAPHI_004155 [Ogataea philodendri]|uniref:Peptidase M20 dimerisation domain-containing protein n=1 Tax=Ogataea philodendri TaxID=1378263 RepID=A0A9P8P6K7_9ASCO|nr:uncharacterized protein OGAPHI_004155 [Ogataea philodendri]KAH3665966.1 hypothetical protein OGAPHI_004155 [Ogataea philodendri]